MIELLSPVGDFECLKAAVQNGADTVYFGSAFFSARAFATNFDDEALEKAITYAKLRGVKTNLTLNTLIKNNEIADAINLANNGRLILVFSSFLGNQCTGNWPLPVCVDLSNPIT